MLRSLDLPELPGGDLEGCPRELKRRGAAEVPQLLDEI
jgi:hypothetical protein